MDLFAVIGLGNFGGTMAIELQELGHRVLAIDRDQDTAQSFRDRLPEVIVADATDRETLESIGLNEASCAIISLGRDLESSVLVTLHCAELGIERIYVKVISSTHGRIVERVGATEAIFPERQAARRLAQKLVQPNIVDFLPISPDYSIEQLRAPDSFVGKTVGEIDLRQRYGVLLVAIRDSSAPDTPVRLPSGDATIRHDDQLVLLGPNDKLARIADLD